MVYIRFSYFGYGFGFYVEGVAIINLNIIWRLFLLQNLRNERLSDGLGFFFVLLPVFKKLSRGNDRMKDYIRRHLNYYNSNPIFSSCIIGAVQNMEERKEDVKDIDVEYIRSIKDTLSSVMAARGDYFFEVILLPLTLTIACIFTIYGLYFGPIIFLIFYNYYHFKFRVGGYYKGLNLGENVVNLILGQYLRIGRFMTAAVAFVAGVFTSIVFIRGYVFGGFRVVGWGFLLVAGVIWLRRKYSVRLSVILGFFATVLLIVIRQMR
ncbi:PTS system mannose/fructose/sorbose family transporter subunit IID [bacterium]|nr:PTS system mannose/fructose/sorbose family transporter subunit IID [bacterium]